MSRQRLRQLREQMPSTPRLVASEGITVAQCGERVVQFASDADAEFFVRACALVVPMLDELDALSRGHETLAQLESEHARVAELSAEIVRLHVRADQANKEIVRLVAEVATLARAVRAGRRAAQTALALQRQVTELQATLDAERNGAKL